MLEARTIGDPGTRLVGSRNKSFPDINAEVPGREQRLIVAQGSTLGASDSLEKKQPSLPRKQPRVRLARVQISPSLQLKGLHSRTWELAQVQCREQSSATKLSPS